MRRGTSNDTERILCGVRTSGEEGSPALSPVHAEDRADLMLAKREDPLRVVERFHPGPNPTFLGRGSWGWLGLNV
eukprot:scaffold281_cov318-Pavlova_lutheri.AAC.63